MYFFLTVGLGSFTENDYFWTKITDADLHEIGTRRKMTSENRQKVGSKKA